MNNIAFNINKYLQKKSVEYAIETGIQNFQSIKYDNIIVIPAFAEMEFLPSTIESLSKSINKSVEKSLCLIVINNPPQKECSTVKLEENQELLRVLRESCIPNTAWIDASSIGKELTQKGGVGAARKIGMDAALTLLNLDSDPLIFSLDADTMVESNYISAVRDYFKGNHEKFALTLNFIHQKGDNPEEEKAIRLYESYMRDYVDKLEVAGSPYAYYSIGSTIVCRAEYYLKAGGMRPKNGGEDFYFLQALRKLNPDKVIGHIDATTVYPSSRASDRVPFGTGPRIEDIITGRRDNVPGRYLHNPRIFEELGKIIGIVENSDISGALDLWYQDLSGIACEFLDSCDFRKVWPKILDNTPDDPEKIKWAFHTWFDAFRTLKFIHFCEKRNSSEYGRVKNQLDK